MTKNPRTSFEATALIEDEVARHTINGRPMTVDDFEHGDLSVFAIRSKWEEEQYKARAEGRVAENFPTYARRTVQNVADALNA
jgi:hypothetical protein